MMGRHEVAIMGSYNMVQLRGRRVEEAATASALFIVEHEGFRHESR